jgi:hypothetical protein
MAWIISDHTVLLKTTKKGETHAAVPKLEELRQIADDINVFSEYGRQLVNAINLAFKFAPVSPVSAFP